MESRSLVPQSSSFQLPIAQVRSVFRPDEVERKLAKLQDMGSQREHDNLRSTYERMLERGPERFQVKPSGVPDMAALYDQLPNFTDALDDVRRHVALSQDSRDGRVPLARRLGRPVERRDDGIHFVFPFGDQLRRHIVALELRQ